MDNANLLKSELHEQGWRLTVQREVILNIFQNLAQGIHLSAEDLYIKLQEQGDSISLSTIYRTVKLMARLGILRELDLAQDHKHYEINQHCPHQHHHLICVNCNVIIEFQSESISSIGLKIAKGKGFQLLDCQLLVHAICPTCQDSNSRA